MKKSVINANFSFVEFIKNIELFSQLQLKTNFILFILLRLNIKTIKLVQITFFFFHFYTTCLN